VVPDRREGTPRRGKRGGWIQVSYRFVAGFALKGRTKPRGSEGRRENAEWRDPDKATQSQPGAQKTERDMPGDGTPGAVVHALSPAFTGH
jgi:hypothetical protein